MESRIQKTLTQWFPDAFTEVQKSALKTDYDFLNHFTKYVKGLIKEDCENKAEPFKIINLLYSKGTLFERNAIENAFFFALAFDENPQTLRENLSLMPEHLRAVYIKTILEN
jgi:HSP90 family molecular chaperone